MVELGVWAAAAACMTVSLSISFWAGRRFETFWPKFVFFLIASVIGIFLFPFFGGLWEGAAPQQEHLIDPAFRKQIWARYRLRCRHCIFRGVAAARDHRKQAQNIDRHSLPKSVAGQRTRRPRNPTSVLPPRPDIADEANHVGFV